MAKGNDIKNKTMKIKNKISEITHKSRRWCYKRYFIYKQLKHLYLKREECDMLTEYVRKRIMEGQTHRREELQQKEAEKREVEIMTNYFKRLKGK